MTEAQTFDAEKLAWDKMGGLLPAIVQHAETGQVLMLGYMNRDALNKTLSSGRVTFWSRSRKALWQKGETSGNFLTLGSLSADCDGDALLVRALPAGPVCHKGWGTCFGDMPDDLHFLASLQRIIRDRKDAPAEESYTARLMDEGIERISQKMGEEAVETVVASLKGDGDALAGEAADLLYHLMVLLEARGLSLDDVGCTLAERHRG